MFVRVSPFEDGVRHRQIASAGVTSRYPEKGHLFQRLNGSVRGPSLQTATASSHWSWHASESHWHPDAGFVYAEDEGLAAVGGVEQAGGPRERRKVTAEGMARFPCKAWTHIVVVAAGPSIDAESAGAAADNTDHIRMTAAGPGRCCNLRRRTGFQRTALNFENGIG